MNGSSGAVVEMGKYFDILAYLMGKQAAGGGGDVTVESKSISSNGTYTAPTGKAYSPVVVNVPNSYAAGDEGKVVSNGALVAQTAHAEVTSNGTIDTTLNNSVVVNVSGGGGSSWTLVGSAEFEVSTTSTTETSVGDVPLEFDSLNANDLIWVHIRDKAGKRNNYFFGTDCVFLNEAKANGTTAALSTKCGCTITYVNNAWALSSVPRGIYPDTVYQTSANEKVTIKATYNSSYSKTIDGTYQVEVYKLTPASGMTMFE